MGISDDYEIRKSIRSVIPHLPNMFILFCMDMMRTRWPWTGYRFRGHNRKNTTAFGMHVRKIEENLGFIEDQHSYVDVEYGVKIIAYNGCEVIAVYNALRCLEGPFMRSFPDLVEYFEKKGMVFEGRLGTAPMAMADFFRKNGYPVKTTTDENEFDGLGEEATTLILSVFNDRDDIERELHSFCISKEGNGYVPHNLGGIKKGKTFNSVTEVLKSVNGGKAKGVLLIGLQMKGYEFSK